MLGDDLGLDEGESGGSQLEKAWLSIPVFARPAGDGFTHAQRMEILDAAYAPDHARHRDRDELARRRRPAAHGHPMSMAAPSPVTSEDTCDHTSVGVLIPGPEGLLMFERATPPTGLAPVAGHIDQHGSPEQAARSEVAEEVGLTVTRLHPLLTQWRPNRCRRTPTGPVGHQWWILQAEVRGTLRPSAREVHAPDGPVPSSSSTPRCAPSTTPKAA
ncbi:NUDIX hydrolase [Streptomyces sp. NPDC059166]|uniref:NUDIX hydrolase n=1 Tax=Streptomyces sp. NPDC059166 TaxID=3346752 RepID=UPI0036A0C884